MISSVALTLASAFYIAVHPGNHSVSVTVDAITPTGVPSLEQDNTTASSACLVGAWRLDNASIAKAMQEALQHSTSGTQFTLEEISGSYVATIADELDEVTVLWDGWQMKGTAVTPNGTFPVTVSLSGTQGYSVTNFTDGNQAADRTMAVQLEYDNVVSTVSFAGQTFSNLTIQIPRWADGTWDCGAETFVVYNDGITWEFTRS